MSEGGLLGSARRPSGRARLGVALLVLALTASTIFSAIAIPPSSAHASSTATSAGVLAPGPAPLRTAHLVPRAPRPIPPVWGGPTPGGPTVCADPGAPAFVGQVVITASGSISPGGAPISHVSDRFELTGRINGSILDLASNATLDGSGCAVLYRSAPSTGYGNSTVVEVRDASNVTVENFPITANGSRVGVWVNHSAAVTVYNVTANSEGIGVGATGSLELNFTLDYALAASTAGIELTQSVNALVQEDQVNESTTGFIASDTEGVTFANDSAPHTTTGITLTQDTGTTVSTSDFADAGTAGASLSSSANDQLSDDNFSGASTYGVKVQGPLGAIDLSQIVATGGHSEAVNVTTGGGGAVTVADSVLANATYCAVCLDDPSGPVTLVGNDLSANASTASTTGILVVSAGNSLNISGNNLTGGLYFGLRLQGQIAGDVTIANNEGPGTRDGALSSVATLAGSLNLLDNNFAATSQVLGGADGVYLGETIDGSVNATGDQLSGPFTQAIVFAGFVVGSADLLDDDFANSTSDSVGIFDDGIGGNLLLQHDDLSTNGPASPGTGVYLNGWGVQGTSVIADCNFTGGLSYGVYWDPGASFEYLEAPSASGALTFEGDNFANTTEAGVDILYTGGNLYVEQNDFAANASTEGTSVGVYVDNSVASYYYYSTVTGSVFVTGNNFTGGVGVALYVDATSVDLPTTIGGSVIVTDNDIANATGDGYGLWLGSVGGNVVVEDNNFSENATSVATSWAIDLPWGVLGSTLIEHNNMADLAGGVFAYYAYGPITIRSNDIGNATDAGIVLFDSDAVTIEDNYLAANATVQSNEPDGIQVEEYATTVTVLDNNLSGLWDGLEVQDANSLLAVGNDLSGTGEYGVSTVDTSIVTVADNELVGSAGTAIDLANATNVSISDNDLDGSANAIVANGTTGPTMILGNDVQGTGTALDLTMNSTDPSYATVQANNFTGSGGVSVDQGRLNFIANDLLDTPYVNLTNDLVQSFYHNDFDTSDGSALNVSGTIPLTGSFNAALPTGGNYWSGCTFTHVSNGIGSPPCAVGAYEDDYPLAQPWYAYPITFTETGLALGATWGVTIGGVGSLTAYAPASVVFYPTNGETVRYAFTVEAPSGWGANPENGTFTANGQSLVISLTFGPLYPISFQESGLPGGTVWNVTLAGVTQSASAGSAISFEEINGTYSYSLSGPAGYRLLLPNATGTVRVVGAANTIAVSSIAVGPNPEAIQYDPANGYLYVANEGSASVTVIDGATNEVVVPAIPVGAQPAGFAYDPANDELFVTNSASSNVTVIDGSTNTVVTNIATGAGPTSAAYDPTNGYIYVTNSLSNNVTVIDGTTHAVVVDGIRVGDHPQGIAYDPTNGELFVVNAQSANVTVIDGATQQVVVPSIRVGTTPAELTYDPVSGDLYVANYGSSNVTVINGATHRVVVAGIGVGSNPNDASYDALNGFVYVAASGNAKVSLIDTRTNQVVGTGVGVGNNPRSLEYDPANGLVYVGNYASSNVTVINGNGPIPTFWAEESTVTFEEEGLVGGTSWGVTFNGTNERTDAPGSIAFGNLLNGTYAYTVSSVSGYTRAPSSGNLTLTGGAVTVTVTFRALYNVTFTEAGLPGRTTWSVTFNGTTETASAPGSIVFHEVVNGSYAFTVGTETGYRGIPSRGNVSVNGASATESISFAAVYSVTFTESSLPAGTSWNVTFNGTTESANAPASIVFEGVVNGTYSFTVGPPTGYRSTPSTGTLRVSGAAVTKSIAFAALFTVTFTETGLPGGTSWTVTFNGSAVTARAPSSIVVADVVNGTYAFNVSAIPGYRITPTSGTITVDGSSVTQGIAFAALYSVSFTETGLPGGTSWSVTFNGSVESARAPASIVFSGVVNGSYSFTVAGISGFRVAPSSGSVSVHGSSVTKAIGFTSLYSVTFTETELPGGTSWNVTLNGTTESANAPTSIVFSDLPNGSYSFAVGPPTDYRSSPSTGTVVVNGGAVTKPVAFTALYSVTFSETGLPGGTVWSVTFNGSTHTATAPASVVIPGFSNGSYAFSVGVLTGYRESPSSGELTVDGAPAHQPITFTALYSVTLTETGLPGGTVWSGTFNGTNESASAPASLLFTGVANGSYSFTITPLPGYRVTPVSGSITVSGSSVTKAVAFSALYGVTFTETGLPAGTVWSVTFNGTTESASAPSSLAFPAVVNGSYDFTVASVVGYQGAPASGRLSVDGASVSKAITFTALPPSEFSVTFTETGLPTGTMWSVTFNGTTEGTSAPTSIVFTAVANGSYPFVVAGVTGFVATPAFGNLTVDGNDVSEPITFSVLPPSEFSVTFTETGLPAGTMWSVTFNGTSESASAPATIVFSGVVNGSYRYQVGAIAGYRANPSSGTVVVAGSSLTEAITFSALPPGQYSVTFNETGLPGGSTWSVTFNGVSASATAPSAIVFTGVVNGSYSFTVAAQAGYRATPASGSVDIAGASVTRTIVFTALPPSQFSVTFSETGLPVGTTWTVTFNGTTQSASAPMSLVFTGVLNGSYAYVVQASGPWAVLSQANGTVTVAGTNPTISVVYDFTSVVTFTQTGIPNGTRWTLQVTLTVLGSAPSAGGVGQSWFTNSSGPTAVLVLPNGTYTYTLTAPGFQTSTAPFHVTGTATSVAIAATPTPSSGPAGTPYWVWVVIGVVIAAVVAAVVVVIWVRRPKPPPPMAAWGASPPAPGAPGNVGSPPPPPGSPPA